MSETIRITRSRLNIPSNKKFVLLRHAKAPHNKPDEVATFAGFRVDNHLNPEASHDIKELSASVAEICVPDIILHSNMIRSRETAEILKGFIEESSGKKILLREIDNFNEIDVGDLTGLTDVQSKEKYPQAAFAFYENRFQDLDFPDGDNYQSLSLRADKLAAEIGPIMERFDNVLAVGHGMFNRFIVYKLAPEYERIWASRAYPYDRIILFGAEGILDEEKT